MKKENAGKYLAILGLLFLLALPWAVANTVLSMYSTFDQITLFGTSDPSSEIATSWVPTVIGMILFIPGFLFLLVSVVGLNYRKNWVFWAILVSSILLLIIFPIGTVLGLVGFMVLFSERKNFGSDVQPTQAKN
ncbi:MAG: hypothetical protein ACI9O6_003113 [Glaciecola sp.]|jgi:hypothetical protein